MNILLLGANGRTGREVLGGALNAGDSVTALVRSRDRLADIEHQRLQIKIGSVCDPKVLEPLLPGHDLVISVLGPRWPTRAATAIYSSSAAAIVEAMQKSSINRLLVTSSALLFPDDALLSRILRRLVPNIVRETSQMENSICTSNLDWTVARLGFLNNDNSEKYCLARDAAPDGKNVISRKAVAHFLLNEAEQSEHRCQVVGLAGQA